MIRRSDFTVANDGVTLRAGVFVTVKKNGINAILYDNNGLTIGNPLLSGIDGSFTYNIAESDAGAFIEEYRLTLLAAPAAVNAVVLMGTAAESTALNLKANLAGATFTGPVLTKYLAASRNTFGSFANAAAASVIANDETGVPQVSGFANPSDLATYADRDSVGLYVVNGGPPPTQTVAAVSFTATTVVLAAAAVASVVVGMIIDTNAATKSSGIITAISANRLTLTVSGWFAMGNTAAGQVPTGTPTLFINPATKVWPINANVALDPTSHADRGAGFELGVFNRKGALIYGDGVPGPTSGTNMLWGFDSVNLGTFQGGVAFIGRGNFLRGFVSRGQANAGFCVEDDPTQDPEYHFYSEASTGSPFGFAPAGVMRLQITAAGAIVSGGTTQNGVSLAPVATGNTVVFGVQGVDANINAVLTGKGAANIVGIGGTGLGNESLRVPSIGGAVNQVQVAGSGAASPVAISAIGADTNIDLALLTKGTGTLRFGTFTTNADAAVNGYITIKDSGGTVRKLATIA